MPASPEECLAHHPEWSGADAEVMWGLMESHDPGEMAAFHGGSMGDMASMMGGGMGHMGLSR